MLDAVLSSWTLAKIADEYKGMAVLDAVLSSWTIAKIVLDTTDAMGVGRRSFLVDHNYHRKTD